MRRFLRKIGAIRRGKEYFLDGNDSFCFVFHPSYDDKTCNISVADSATGIKRAMGIVTDVLLASAVTKEKVAAVVGLLRG